MSRDASRAGWGRAAISAGTPDAGSNGDDLAGVQVDAGDTIANVLHAVAAAAEREHGVEQAALDATTVLETARSNFHAEHFPDDIEISFREAEIPYPPPHSTVPPVVLVIRDPDHENEYVVDGQIRTIDIDLGSSFNGPKDFDPESDWGQEWLADTRQLVADLPESSEVRQRVESLCDDLGAVDDS